MSTPRAVAVRAPPIHNTRRSTTHDECRMSKRKDFFEQCLIGRNERGWQPSWLLTSQPPHRRQRMVIRTPGTVERLTMWA